MNDMESESIIDFSHGFMFDNVTDEILAARSMGRIPVIEADKIGEISIDRSGFVRQLGHPAIIIERHQRPVSSDETSFGMSKATYITGYDSEGNQVTTRGFYERKSRTGKRWEAAMEKWKIGRVKRTLGRSAVPYFPYGTS